MRLAEVGATLDGRNATPVATWVAMTGVCVRLISVTRFAGSRSVIRMPPSFGSFHVMKNGAVKVGGSV